ncbi:MAG: hypothetical protein U0587_08180 [Candidatus Binatia bacterium]
MPPKTRCTSCANDSQASPPPAASLKNLPLFVITATRLRLDDSTCCEQLCETVEKGNPALLVLDLCAPARRRREQRRRGRSAKLLRKLQRQHHLAVALVHHARKDAGRLRPGRALRGSSEFHAWGDSNLYLRRRDQLLRLSVEHRAARAPDDLTLELAADPLALRIAKATPPELAPPDQPSPAARIEQALLAADAPLGVRELRAPHAAFAAKRSVPHSTHCSPTAA